MTDFFSRVDGQINDTGVISCEVNTGETVAIGTIVKVAAAVTNGMPKIAVCGAGDIPLGVVIGLGDGNSGAAGKVVSVAVVGSGIVTKVVASGDLTLGALATTAADGEIADMTGTPTVGEIVAAVGIMLHDAAADQDEVAIVLR